MCTCKYVQVCIGGEIKINIVDEMVVIEAL